jgi:O-antigen ligase
MVKKIFIFIIALSFGVPYRYQVGGLIGSVSFFDVMLILFSICMILFIFHRDGAVKVGDVCVFKLLFFPIPVCIMSLLWTFDINVTFKYLVILIESIFAYLIFVNILYECEFENIVKLILGIVIVLLATSLFSYFGISYFSPVIPFSEETPAYNRFVTLYYARLSSPVLGFSNNLALVLTYWFFVCLTLSIVLNKIILYFISSLIFASIVLTASSSALLAIFLILPFFIYWLRINLNKILCILIVVVLLFFALFFLAIKYNPIFLMHLDSIFIPSSGGRIDLWKDVLRAVNEYCFLGFGGGVTPSWHNYSFSINTSSAHNTYLQHFLFYGYPIGLLTICSFILIPFVFFRSKSQELVKKIERGVVASILSQFIIFVFHPAFEGAMLKPIFYANVGISLLLIKAFERKEVYTISNN